MGWGTADQSGVVGCVVGHSCKASHHGSIQAQDRRKTTQRKEENELHGQGGRADWDAKKSGDAECGAKGGWGVTAKRDKGCDPSAGRGELARGNECQISFPVTSSVHVMEVALFPQLSSLWVLGHAVSFPAGLWPSPGTC